MTARNLSVLILFASASLLAGPGSPGPPPVVPVLPTAPTGSAPVLVPEVLMGGSFAPGDPTLEQLLPAEVGDTTFADSFVLNGVAGESVRVEAAATVPVYLAIVDPMGERLAGAGTQGDETAPALEVVLSVTGPHRVIVNSFNGDVASYTITYRVVSGSPSPLPTPAPPIAQPGLPPLLLLGASTAGRLEPGDAPLEALVPGNDGDTTWTDLHPLGPLSERGVRIQASADVPIYLALLDARGELLAGAGASGDEREVRILYVPHRDESYSVAVNSYHGSQGGYTLSVQEATFEDLVEVSEGMPVDGVLTPAVPLTGAVEPSERAYETYVVDVPEGATTLTITTESVHNIDLFVRYGVQIISSWNTEPDFSGTSDGGNEVVRLSQLSEPPLRPGRYYIDVVAFSGQREDQPAALPFTITAEVTQTVIPVIVDVAPINTESMVTGMFAAQLTPGRRVNARIEPSVSPLQVWTVQVPLGANRLEVRTFDAGGRLDMVIAPPGVNLPSAVGDLLTLPYRAVTARDNERVVIEASSSPPLRAGVYTVAVLDLYSEVASDYQIAVGVDEGLAAEDDFEGPTFEQLAALSPMERAVRSTVQLTLSLQEGGLEFGSGTILTPDGIILTNHHVIGHCDHSSPYLLGCVGDVYRGADGNGVDLFVGLNGEHESSAEQHFVAHVIRTLPDFDLSLLQIVSDLDGNPVTDSLPWAPVRFGPDAVALGDPVAVIGYPGVAGLGSRISLSMTRGFVTGFTDDRGHRVFINVDANIAGGNSGGALVDDEGVLVGVPSNQNLIRERGERQDYARSLTLVPAEWVELLRAHGADLR